MMLGAFASRPTSFTHARKRGALRVSRVCWYHCLDSPITRIVRLWMEAGGGLSQMENAFPDDTLKIVFSKPGPTVVKPSTVRVSAAGLYKVKDPVFPLRMAPGLRSGRKWATGWWPYGRQYFFPT